MADSIYVKVGDGVEQLDLGGGSAPEYVERIEALEAFAEEQALVDAAQDEAIEEAQSSANKTASGLSSLTSEVEKTANIAEGSLSNEALLSIIGGFIQNMQCSSGASNLSTLPAENTTFDMSFTLPFMKHFPYQIEVKAGYYKDSNDTVYFNIPFKRKCFSVVPIPCNSGSTGNIHTVQLKDKNEASFTTIRKWVAINNDSKTAHAETSAVPMFWIAIGC